MYCNSLKKAISVATILTFLFANNFLYASQDSKSIFKNKKVDYEKLSNQTQDIVQKKKSILSGEDSKQTQSQQKETQKILSSHLSDISLIHLPPELGRIVEVYQAQVDKGLIVHIQDLHTNPEAEYNLAKILEILLNDYKMGLVCSEGADGIVDTSSVSTFPDYGTREKISKIFVNAGELTGEEYLSITKYPNLPIWGIENKDIYFRNIIDFNRIMKFSPQSQIFISQAKKALEELKKRIYTKELLELDQKEADYKAQKIESPEYITYLSSYITKLNIPIANYKNITLLTETIDTEKKIDQLKIINESQNLLLNLQSSLSAKSVKSEVDSLMAKSSLFKDQKISPFSFYSYLKDLALKHIVIASTEGAKQSQKQIASSLSAPRNDFEAKYPNLNSFLDYLTKVNAIDSTRLFLELEDLNFEIKQSLSKTEEQKTLVKALRNIDFLEGFFNLKVSNEELDYYLNNRESHKVAFFETFLKPILKKYNIDAFIDYNSSLIDPHLAELEEFYKVVKDRDIAMVDNSISEIERRNSRVSSLIAGGFHTKGITRLLKEKGYSYIVISPYSKTDMDEKNYHFLLTGKRKPLVDLLKQLDLDKIVKRFGISTSLRVNMGCDMDMDVAIKSDVVPALARIWGTSPQELDAWALPIRIEACLVAQSAALGRTDFKGWQSIVGLEMDDKGVIKFISKEGDRYYVSITPDNKVQETLADAFKGTVVLTVAAGTRRVGYTPETEPGLPPRVDLGAREPREAGITEGSLFNLLNALMRLRDDRGVTEISTGDLKKERTAVAARTIDREIEAGRLLGILEGTETSRGIIKFTKPFSGITHRDLYMMNHILEKITGKGLDKLASSDKISQELLPLLRYELRNAVKLQANYYRPTVIIDQDMHKPLTPEEIASIRGRIPEGAADSALETLRKSPVSDKKRIVVIDGSVRGSDGLGGSSQDLVPWQRIYTPIGAERIDDYPMTSTMPSEFRATTVFGLADDANTTEYSSPSHGIIRPDVIPAGTMDIRGQTNQRKALAFIMEFFKLRGISAQLEKMPKMVTTGGMESSGAANMEAAMFASMLSKAGLNMADIMGLTVKLENTALGGYTGGQGQICFATTDSEGRTGLFLNVWLGGEKNEKGELINPTYSVLSIPIITDEEGLKKIEGHTLLVQAGKKYNRVDRPDGTVEIVSEESRTAYMTNDMWMTQAEYSIPLAMDLHQRKKPATWRSMQAVVEFDFETCTREAKNYVDYRDGLTKNAVAIIVDQILSVEDTAIGRELLERVNTRPQYAILKGYIDRYQREGRDLNELKDISFYSLDPISTLIKKAWEKEIALFPVGAGGPGSNLFAISKHGKEYIKRFLESLEGDEKISELTTAIEEDVTTNGGTLKGYRDFNIARVSYEIEGAEELGLKPPAGPISVRVPKDNIQMHKNYTVTKDGNLDVYTLSDGTNSYQVKSNPGEYAVLKISGQVNWIGVTPTEEMLNRKWVIERADTADNGIEGVKFVSDTGTKVTYFLQDGKLYGIYEGKNELSPVQSLIKADRTAL